MTFSFLLLAASVAQALRYDSAYAEWNLNTNQEAVDPLDYSGVRSGHTYHPSPENWRFPFYSLTLDRWVNGDPSNDNANGTLFEQDVWSTQLRHGGDIQGLVDSLDYIQGMGIKGIYIAGSPFINQPWGADAYSPLDLSLLDAHFGNITTWQKAIDDIHSRGMYIVLDNTMATLGDLIGFKGHLNTTAEFTPKEYKVLYKSERQYHDFQFGNDYNDTCDYPRFWDETGLPINKSSREQFKGCYNSDFDQYGDTEAFGVHPDYQRQITKFASVQDRLREWIPSVRQRLEVFSCMTITQLDIDGFRFDKAAQVTADAQGNFSAAIRECAAKVGKKNFFLPGELTPGNSLSSIYLGRGREPDQQPGDLATAMNLTGKASEDRFYLRDKGQNALDAAAFHYWVYHFLTRFLGMSGNLEAGYDLPLDWVNGVNQMILTNDLVNPNTGEFDPRHMYGVTNQDNFRWPAIDLGIERELLGLFITTLFLPGIPLLYYGQEQGLYVLDSTADNYLFGRQPITPAPAWKMHGCYSLGASQYINWPIDQGRHGCEDDNVPRDHRDPSHPMRNILKAMYAMRENYDTLTEGWLVQQLANQTDSTILYGSTTPTERGIWSIARAFFPTVQGQFASDPVWFVYHNRENTTSYNFDCSKNEMGFFAPFDANAVLKNLFYPYDEIILKSSPKYLGFSGSSNASGCLSEVTLAPFEYRAYVAKSKWKEAPPLITKFSPGHDVSIDSANAKGSVDISFHFSREMDCDGVAKSMTISSLIEGNDGHAEIDNTTVKCTTLTDDERPPYVGAIGSKWSWSATIQNVRDGIHSITVKNAATKDGKVNTNSTDKFLLRVGAVDNPVVWPMTANYSATLLTKSNSDLFVNHHAAGASSWRYSTNWGSSWSDWQPYTGGKQQIEELPWSGTSLQAWSGDHVMVQYYSSPLGSSSIIQQGDATTDSNSRLLRRDAPTGKSRRFPHLFVMGDFNQFGFDAGIHNEMEVNGDGEWEMHFMDEWPSSIQLNVWGINPDGKPDQTYILGDVDNDGIGDRLAPTALSPNRFDLNNSPPGSSLSYKLRFDDNTLRFNFQPQGSRWLQLFMFILLAVVPVVGGLFAVWIFMGSFYKVKINKIGFKSRGRSPLSKATYRLSSLSFEDFRKSRDGVEASDVGIGATVKRRTVLIATMEYNIDDWNIKIKIGGLGVMAQLMGKALEHQDLIWVVPCVGGIDYPIDQRDASMYPVIMGKEYEVEVQYHRVNNITYVLLDAPIFRKQNKADPYPPRMDDMESAIYYSAWNYCIAETMRRFPVDLYHINDYHGAAAPLYLLPDRTIPCALSLHNAEFQGMWPMRTPEESKEVANVFNLDMDIVKDYVQFGSVFNLLHAGASYLRIHQKGFGAVGVSKKYGDRSYARYPIFWGLSKIGQLPNPDPSDTAQWSKEEQGKLAAPTIDEEFESKRGGLRKQAQEWAGLEIDPTAELFVFVGRWSLQKGVDLIADIFPSILEKHLKTQLICVGPVIDLYGKFAALKLEKLMLRYPKRVCSKPVFTALPPYIFSGAEFALIPSRDEPFGLVAVEFGRKGALGVGARVGGLGQMPGFWYTIESTSPRHLLHQFRGAIVSALETKQKTRVKMRAWSAKQRFPVAQWLEDLEKLQSEAIRLHDREARKSKRNTSGSRLAVPSTTDLQVANERLFDDTEPTPPPSTFVSRSVSPLASRASSPSLPIFASRRGSPRDSPSLRPRGRQPRVSSLPLQPSQTSDSESPNPPGHLLPPSPFYAGEDSEDHSSSDSLVTMMNTTAANSARDDAYRSLTSGEGVPSASNALSSHQSVDSLAFHIMAPDSSGTSGVLPGSSVPNRVLTRHRNSSRLSVLDVVGDRTDYKLQKVDPFFNDSTGEYYREFDKKLDGLTAKNSEDDLCIEEYLTKSEREWFKKFKDAKLGRSRSPSASPLRGVLSKTRVSSTVQYNSIAPSDDEDAGNEIGTRTPDQEHVDEFLLGKGYKPPTGLKKFLQIRLGDWPIYSILLALGQILSANSYQIVLLTGDVSGQTATKLYMVAGTYAATSIIWWLVYRRFQSLYSLTLPWFFYGLAFLLLGISPFVPAHGGRSAVQDIATCMYATGASTGSLFFAVNFGDEGGAPVSTWLFRACVIQGVQQLYMVALWYWGSIISTQSETATMNGHVGDSSIPLALVATVPIAVVLWAVGIVLFVGLPDYYRQSGTYIPSFYKALLRRHIVPWFFLAVVIQNYWLSTPYGRNWQFLFSSKYIPGWSALLLAVGFFVIVWALLLWMFSKFSLSHPWILPMFSLGLGAPRWAQMLWGTSGIGLYLPWLGGSAVTSALVSRMLWLWLGVLDTVQGVGVGMVLLLTLTRQHVAATLIGAQFIGSITTIVARATAPDKIGPGDVFPDFSAGITPGITKAWFWVALGMQLIIPLGYFKFFRKEQVAKP